MANKLKCFYQNTRGLRTKIAHGLKNRISCLNYDIIALTETWLNDKINSNEIFDGGLFVVHRSDRTSRTYTRPNNSNASNNDNFMGGGALIAINKNIPALRLTDWELETPYENVWLKISTSNKTKLFINCVYINNVTSFDRFVIYLDLLHDIINRREPNAKFIILGDFNLSCIEWYFDNNKCTPVSHEGRMAKELINTLTCTNMIQFNHIKNHYNRTLDLILSNSPITDCCRTLGIVDEDPYHPPISFKFESKDINFMKLKRQNKFNFFKADYSSINNSLELIDWNSLFDNLDVNGAVGVFYETLQRIMDAHTPITKFNPNQYPIWYSRELIKVINEKEHYFTLKRITRNPIIISLYREKRSEFNRLKKRCLYEYELNIESKVKHNPKCFFAYTKSLQKSNYLPPIMKYKDQTAENLKDTTNLFAQYFSSVYTNSGITSHFNCQNNCNDYFPISEDDIKAVITSLDKNKINSPDGIPILFYKNTINNIASPLLSLFKLSLRTMQYPDLWKISHVTPIHKAGDSTNVENYRPISILSAAAKIFDKLIYRHILSRTSHLISKHQHGFSVGKSTVTNLLEHVNFIANNITGGGQIDVIFMDLAKAFDKLIHDILLNKLRRYPLDPCLIVLLRSYLVGRMQYVCVYGEKSECITPNSSVPQGSVLSPLLFALFINDLPPLLTSIILLFADDVKILRKIISHDDSRALQRDADAIFNWCIENGLELNIKKCSTMTFTRKPQSTTHQYIYTLNGLSLPKVSTCKDLGITFDSKLTFEPHFINITSRAYKMLGFISRSLNKFRLMSTYNTLYNTYVRSIIEYCSTVWNPHYDIYIQEIERIQKRFTRMIYRKFHYPYEAYESRLMRLEMISLESRRLMIDEITLYKIRNGLLITSLKDSLSYYNINRVTRQNRTFYLPPVTTNIEFFAPMLRLQRQHNDSFNNVQLDEPSLNAFKRYVKYEVERIDEANLV